jgi:hypothetical protein
MYVKLKMKSPKPGYVVATILLLISTAVFSQEFAGTVRWTVTLQYSDPADQARMEAALKKQQQTSLQAEVQKRVGCNSKK